MAPEQAKGQAVDQRADVYALGLIMRDMLLGSRHAGATTEFAELMARMQEAPAPMRTLDATIPEAIDALVTRCLQPDPAARYQTSAELLRDLERVAGGGGSSRCPPGKAAGGTTLRGRMAARGKLRRAVAAAAVAVVLAAAAFGVWRWYGASRGRRRPAGRRGRWSRWRCSRSGTRRATRRSIRSARASAKCWRPTSASRRRSARSRRCACARCSAICGSTRTRACRRRTWPASPTSPARRPFSGASTSSSATRSGSTRRSRTSHQQKTTPLKATAANQSGLLASVGQLAGSVQQALAAGSADVLNELKASAWRPTTQSFEALRLYNDGLNLLARRQPPGRREAVRGGGRRGRELRARVFGARADLREPRLRREGRAAVAPRDRLEPVAPAPGTVSDRRRPLPHHERQREGDRDVREAAEGVAQQREDPVRRWAGSTSGRATWPRRRSTSRRPSLSIRSTWRA